MSLTIGEGDYTAYYDPQYKEVISLGLKKLIVNNFLKEKQELIINEH